MTALFKPARPFPLPAHAEVVTHKGKPHARVGGALYPLSKDGTKFLKPTASYYADIPQADGRRKRVKLSPNKAAAQVLLTAELKRVENEKAGIRSPLMAHQRKPLADLLAEYERNQLDRGTTPKHAAQAAYRCRTAFDACGFVVPADLDATRVERWLADRRSRSKPAGGISAQTSNHIVVAVKAFCNWCVRSDRLPANPFRHLSKVRVDVDVRHERRSLTVDEFDRLAAAAHAGGEYRHLSGPDRRRLYVVAGMTGLRAAELASLTPASFALDADPPTLTVQAGYSKRRRRDVLPLHAWVVGELRGWLAGKKPGEPLWGGTWAKYTQAVLLIRHDLAAARAAWLAEVATPEERAKRERSDFLAYRDAAGRVADFHSLRHRFVSELVRSGVGPKDAQELSRLSTVTLTLGRYAHTTMPDKLAAINKLPAVGGGKGGAEPDAAPDAAEPDSGRGFVRAGDEVDPSVGRSDEATESLDSEPVEEDRGEVGTEEESTPRRIRTFNLRFRRRPVGGARLTPNPLPGCLLRWLSRSLPTVVDCYSLRCVWPVWYRFSAKLCPYASSLPHRGTRSGLSR